MTEREAVAPFTSPPLCCFSNPPSPLLHVCLCLNSPTGSSHHQTFHSPILIQILRCLHSHPRQPHKPTIPYSIEYLHTANTPPPLLWPHNPSTRYCLAHLHTANTPSSLAGASAPEARSARLKAGRSHGIPPPNSPHPLDAGSAGCDGLFARARRRSHRSPAEGRCQGGRPVEVLFLLVAPLH